MTLAPSLVNPLQAFDLPSRLVAGEECLGNGGEVRAGGGLEFHRSGPIYCELDERRSRTGPAGPALSFCGISCRSILLRKSRRGGMADAEDLKSSGRERPCGFIPPPVLDLRRYLDRITRALGKNLVRLTPWHWGGIAGEASHMASLQNRNGSYRILFDYQRKQRTFTVGRVSEAEARAKADQVDYLLMRLSQGLLALPAGIDIVAFVRHDGIIPASRQAPIPRGEPTLAGLRDRYIETHGASLENHTMRGIRRHFRHFCGLLGEGFPIRKLSLADLQGYVDRRARARGRRGPLNPATIEKEIVTLRTAWNWGVRMQIVSGRYPYDGLGYPKV